MSGLLAFLSALFTALEALSPIIQRLFPPAAETQRQKALDWLAASAAHMQARADERGEAP